jgi:CDP-paratose 2-epimerase
VINAFWNFAQHPRPGEVYNLGGGRDNAASVIECINLIEKVSGKRPQLSYTDTNRIGDHICYYSDLRKLHSHFPGWKLSYSLEQIVVEMVEAVRKQQRV